jgi:hypothetical protein
MRVALPPLCWALSLAASSGDAVVRAAGVTLGIPSTPRVVTCSSRFGASGTSRSLSYTAYSTSHAPSGRIARVIGAISAISASASADAESAPLANLARFCRWSACDVANRAASPSWGTESSAGRRCEQSACFRWMLAFSPTSRKRLTRTIVLGYTFGRETPIRTFPDISGQIRTFPPDIWASGDPYLDSTITGLPFCLGMKG